MIQFFQPISLRRHYGVLLISVLSGLIFFSGEVRATNFNVTTLSDGGAGSLRAAIQAANADPSATDINPHVIDISSLSGVILLDSAFRNIENHITINGPSDNSVEISRNQDPLTPTFSVFLIKPLGLPTITVRLNNLVISGGASLTGGGIYVENSTLVMTDCRVTRNTVNNGLGGGICSNNADVSMFDCTIDDNLNLAGLGGGVYMNFGSFFMNNCTVFGNRASIGGGFDKASVGSVIINNCTFAYDTADDVGGGMYINSGNIEINNSIFTGSFANNGHSDISGTSGTTVFSTHGHNLIGDSAGFSLSGNTTNNNLGFSPGTDVLSSNLQNNGGPTPTLLLLPCSPAIDGGTGAAYANPATALDQRGFIRNNFGTSFDIGAVEYSGPTVADVSRCGPGDVTLTATAGTNFIWYSDPVGGTPLGFGPSLTINVNSTTSFYVVDVFGTCESTPRIEVVANVLPLAPQPVVTPSGPTTFCEGGSVDLVSSTDTSYVSFSWTPGPGSNQTLSVNQSGSYTVTVVDANGCSSTSVPLVVTVNPNPTPVITSSGSLDLCAGSTLVLSSSVASGNVWSPNGETSQSILISNPGTFSVTVTDVNGCIGTSAPVTINGVPIPQTPLITASGLTTFCQGDSIILTSNSASGNLWSPGGETTPEIIVNSGGVYSLTTTDTNGCVSQPASVTITVNPLPVANITADGPTTFCQGGSVNLISSSTTGNVWSPNGETISQINVTSSGNYSVLVTDANACSALSNTIQVTVLTVPVPPVISPPGPLSFCQGDSVVLSSSITSGIVWNPGGETSSSITVTQSGQYSVSFDVGNGCAAVSLPVTVTVLGAPTTPVVTASGLTTFCQGDSVQLSSSVGSGIVWTPSGQTTPGISVNTSGTYGVVVTGANGCTATSNQILVQVNTLPQQPQITSSGPIEFCQGGSVTLASSSASGNTWSNGSTDNSIVVSQSGTFSVIVTDGNNCSSTSLPVVVIVNPIPAQPVISPAGPLTLCDGNNATLSSSVSTGISWNTGATVADIQVSQAGTYLVTATDANGCTSQSAPVVVSVNDSPTIPNLGADITQCGGTVTFDAGNQNTGSSYLWSNGQTTQTITVSQTSTISVVVTNACGSVTSNTVNVTINPVPPVPTVTSSGLTTFCLGDSVILTSSASSGNTWNNGITTQSITVNQAGSYFVTVSNSFGCSSSSVPVSVLVDSPPVIPNLGGPYVQCAGTVTLDAGNAGGSTTYAWSPNGETSQTITVSSSGVYSVQVNNSCGSVSSNSATVTINTNPPAPVISPAGPITICSGDSVQLSSDISGNIIWSNGETSQSIFVNQSGSYFVTFSDGLGCSSSSLPVVVIVQSPLSAPNIGGPFTQCGGSVTLSAGAPAGSVTYLWAPNGETTSSIIVDSSATYSVAITNVCGTVSSNQAVVTINPVPPQPVISPGGAVTFCIGGSITLTSSAGTGNTWNTGDTTNSITVNQPGSYSVSVTNSFNCSSSSVPVVVTVDNPPTPTNLGGPYNQCGGTVTLDAGFFGGSTSYSWSNGDTTRTISVSQSGSYSAIITNSCGSATTTVAQVSIQVPPAQPVIVPQGPLIFCQGDSVVLVASTGGTNLPVIWSNGELSPSIVVNQSGTFTVTVFSALNCSTISAPVNVVVDSVITSIDLGGPYNQCGGTVTLDAGNLGGSTQYAWSNGQTGQTITVNQSGTYSVIATNSCGTATSSNALVNIQAAPDAPIISPAGPINLCQGSTTTLSIVVDPSIQSILWSDGGTGSSITVSTSGSYTVTVTTANGCTATSAPVVVNIGQPLTSPDLGGPFTQCAGSVTLDAQLTGPGLTYAWSNGSTGQTISVSTSGNYSVVVSNACGSVTSTTAQVTINSLPTVPVLLPLGPTTFCAGSSVELTYQPDPSYTAVQWSTGSTNDTISVSTAGLYTVTVFSGNNCSATSAPADVVVDVPATLNSLGGPYVQCGGTVILDPGPAGGSTTFSWSNGSSGQTLTVSTSGNYFVVVSNACGIDTSSIAQVTISPNPVPPVITSNIPLPACIGDTVILSSSYASGNVWNTGDSTQTIVVLARDTFNVTVNLGPGCVATSADLIVPFQSPIVNLSLGQDQTVCGGPAILNAGNGGSTYVWTDITGNNSLPPNQVVGLVSSGSVFVVVTNACNTATSDTVNVTVNPEPPTPIVTPPGPLQFCPGDSAVLVASIATTPNLILNGNFNFGTLGFSSAYTNSNNLIPEQTYQVGPNANAFHPSFVGTGNPGNFLVVNGSSTPGLPVWQQTVTVQPAGNYDFSLSLASVVANNPGQIQFRVDGANVGPVMNCPAATNTWTNFTRNFTNGSNTTVVLSLHSMSAASGGNDFGIDNIALNCTNCGTFGTFVWSNGDTGTTTTVNATGNYTVSLVSGNNCSSTSLPVQVNVVIPPTAPAFAGPVNQCGGTLTLDAGNPGSRYIWSTGDTTQTITLSNPGVYTISVVVFNACGIDTSNTISVNLLSAPVVNLGGPFAICNGGSVVLDAGNPGSTYLWNVGGQTSQTITVNSAGSYSVSVTDPVSGCVVSDTAVVNVNAPPVVTLGGTFTQCSAPVVLDAGFFGPNTNYLWSNGETTQIVNVINPGTTTLTVIVSNACGADTSSLITVNLFNPAQPAIIIPQGPTTFCQGDSVVLTASPGTSYFWVPGGQTTQSITVSQTGLYGVTVTNANGCTSIAPAVFVDVNNGNLPPAEITIVQGTTSFCQGGSVTLSANSSSGLNVLWGPSGSNQTSITVFNDGFITLTLTDQNGCQSQTDTVDINVFFNPAAFITVNGDLSLCEGDSVQLVAPFDQPYTYQWSNGETDSSVYVSTAGSYTVTVTNSNNCSSQSAAIAVTVNPNPSTPGISVNGNISCFQGSVTLISDQTSGNQWSTGETTSSIVVTQPGTYILSIEDANGCKSGADTVSITSNNNLSVALSSPVNVENGLNILCYKGADGKAEASVSGGTSPYTYSWSNGTTGPVIDGLKGGEENKYTVTVTDANGCTITGEIVLSTPANAMDNIPDAFSPDGDGVNEKYIIPGIESYERVELAIFNRWGNEVYNSNGAYRNENAWDGRGPNGQQVPEGTYFVVIKATSATCGTFEEPRYVEIRRK